MKLTEIGRPAVDPAEDFGFFGPDSITWKVWTYPTVATVGFQRAVVVEEFDPALVAAVAETNAVRERSRTRYDRTVAYFALVAVGGTREALKAADVLVKIHSKAIGADPLTGRLYDANDPDSQLWILLTGWHSILKVYEMYGPGKLSPADEEQYWAECAIAAELQTCDPDSVPRSRDGVREYFDRVQPTLAGSVVAQEFANFMLNAREVMPPTSRFAQPLVWMMNAAMRAAVIATMPHWMRRMAGVSQSQLVDAAIVPVMKVAHRLANSHSRLKIAVLQFVSPSTVRIAAPALLGVAPRDPRTMTPEQARLLHGYPRPVDAHREWRDKQRRRVLEENRPPSDEGLIESEAIIGRR